MTPLKMTSRERILAAINHESSDKIPVDWGATPSSGISAIAYSRLKKYMGITEGKSLVYEPVQQIAQPESFMLERFGVDVIDVGRIYNTGEDSWYPVTVHGEELHYPRWFRPEKMSDGGYQFKHQGDLIAYMPADGWFFDQVWIPYKNGLPSSYEDLPDAMAKVMWAKIASPPWDHAAEPDFWEKLRANCIHLRETTDKALVLGVGCNLFEWGTFVRGLDGFLSDLLRRPAQVEQFLDALMEVHLVTLEHVCKAVGDVVDIVKFGDDLGVNDRPFMRPSIYQHLFNPHHTRLCSYVHDHSQMHTMLHSCGDIYRLMPDLVDAGFEIINPVQINCEEMDPTRLKEEFGSKITFWGGGADTRGTLISGTPAQVKDHVTGLLNIFSPGGGYVFNTVHNILPDVPPANIVAMFEAVQNYEIKNGKDQSNSG